MMRGFFSGLSSGERGDPEQVAVKYSMRMWARVGSSLRVQKKLSRSRYYVGISADVADFEDVTKRVALVSDTLLLSGDWNSGFHQVMRSSPEQFAADWALTSMNTPFDGDMDRSFETQMDLRRALDNHPTKSIGIHSPDLAALGRWLLDSEPLLKAGLAWHLPNYSTRVGQVVEGSVDHASFGQAEQVTCIDYLVRDGRAVDASGAHPIKSRIVRPILEIELPFIDGVGLRDFSEITASEFNSYTDFRAFLRKSLLELDDAVNAVQSEQALMRIAADIEQQLHSVRAQMAMARRRRALAVSGAAVGTVGAVLAAVYGPAMEDAFKLIAASSAGSGIWTIIDAATSNSPRELKEDRWHYVWALSRKAQALN
ncbi:hypothetical protein Slala05_81140 [Streptomyces lavendulae subsp. lavendulae]|nr:hypothetical protein Slala05_81140 [Streptomyces lavendulae subsp. lavendulae]